jgi:WD40 repeat protein
LFSPLSGSVEQLQKILTCSTKNDRGFVYAVAWSFDGNLLASGGDDSRIILWDAKTGELLTEWYGHR